MSSCPLYLEKNPRINTDTHGFPPLVILNCHARFTRASGRQSCRHMMKNAKHPHPYPLPSKGEGVNRHFFLLRLLILIFCCRRKSNRNLKTYSTKCLNLNAISYSTNLTLCIHKVASFKSSVISFATIIP